MSKADNVLEKGYLDYEIDPSLSLNEEIIRLKKEKNAVILAHYYQEPEIQEIADFVGDSLDLSRNAAATDADMIVFAGVHFMAETAKILSPDKKVVLPDLNAGCSLAESCPPDQFKAFKEAHPDHLVISYINCSAEIKALSDIICTSSNALQIIESIPQEQPIIFAPDINLGKFLMKVSGRPMKLWNGACMVHDDFSLEKIRTLKEQYPQAQIIAHPECSGKVLEVADYIGSTSKLLSYTAETDIQDFIVVTEAGILHQMRKAQPEKNFIPAPLVQATECACGECPYMKMNSLQKLYLCLKYELPEITLSAELRKRALKPLERMLELSEAKPIYFLT
jgi:quinolinate synthase